MIASLLLLISLSAQSGQITILDVVYGRDERTCRALDAARARCEGQTNCELRAEDRLCGDPYRGVRKELFVAFHCGDGARYTVSVMQDEIARLHCPPPSASRMYAPDDKRRNYSRLDAEPNEFGAPPAGWQEGRLYIADARFGIGTRTCEAVTAFRQACEDRGRCSIAADEALCGDPAPGITKEAVVHYWCNGELRNAFVQQGQTARLACP